MPIRKFKCLFYGILDPCMHPWGLINLLHAFLLPRKAFAFFYISNCAFFIPSFLNASYQFSSSLTFLAHCYFCERAAFSSCRLCVIAHKRLKALYYAPKQVPLMHAVLQTLQAPTKNRT